MPIFDSDSTTNREIGRLYDNDGTTNREIGAVYDNDGATNRLIYKAEKQIYPGTTVQVSKSFGTSGVYSGFSVALATNADNQNSYVPYIIVNMSLYKTLFITGYITTNIGVPSNAGFVVHTSINYAFYSVGGGSSYTQMLRRNGGGVFDETWTVNVGGLSGNYYITTQAYNQFGNCSSTAGISKIIGEYI